MPLKNKKARIDDVAVADVVPATDLEIGGDFVEMVLTNNNITVTSLATTRVPQTTGTTLPTLLPNRSNNDDDDDSSSIDIDMDEVLFEVQQYLSQKNDDEDTPEEAVAKAEKQKNRAVVMRIAEAIADDPNLSEEEKGPALREAANQERGLFESAGFVQATAQEYEEYEAKCEALKKSLVQDWEELRRLTNNGK